MFRCSSKFSYLLPRASPKKFRSTFSHHVKSTSYSYCSNNNNPNNTNSNNIKNFSCTSTTNSLPASDNNNNNNHHSTYCSNHHSIIKSSKNSSNFQQKIGIVNSTFLTPKRNLHLTNRNFQDLVDVLGPAFAESITEGDIKWLKSKGDFIKADEVVAQIETDKTVVDVPAPQDGVIETIVAPEGSKVTAKQKLFVLRPGSGGGASSGQAAPAPAPPGPAPSPAATAHGPGQPPAGTPPPPPPPSPQPMRSEYQPPAMPPPSAPRAAPVVTPAPPRSITTSPPHVSAEKAITGARAETRVKMNRMRLRIAARLKDAQNTYAMLTTFNQIDMTNILALRSKYKDAFAKKHGVKLGLMSPFIKAAAYALLDAPIVNAVIDEGEIVYRHFIDMSVAVATERGLVVPVLRNVESMNYAQIEMEINELGVKARDNKLAIEDMEGGTFTISNGGVFGSLMGTPIINPPQSAILGMHATNEKPVAVQGKVEIRPIMLVALTYDHRLIDGREAVTFLRKIKQAVEDPAIMLLDL